MMRRELLIEKYISPTEVKKTKKEWLNKHGKLHSFNDQPSQIYYWKSGKIMSEYWCKSGIKHRSKGKPTVIWYDSKGQMYRKEWYKNGKYIKGKDYYRDYYGELIKEKHY